ncbi:tRNA (adenosine(37)-N6)-dimethylallyltransferase MiaA [Bifidobacterium sp. W8108]|uniref:tRNA (adenosine(37)-N6)-dimethylallyltransferase MiaA n=1 Tax=unclassified Bifidobacterium TaxID=2608897 RepID=UPI0018DEC46B|nr:MULTISPECIES: tRNA (adenosine(37)-N6)-dimethylallyltransferase MiaA [unclassified Bifidobacterium]MBH9978988.1 tRNA (adenosine(37)-N6)-dimethylallyltransferase MiaA [Bifidobacterium sp. W8108]MBI0173141.1 tRNA (adenosine(37)-N6)-dimethylallyltransferase MiaA [Bifidobacterium sp. M0307]
MDGGVPRIVSIVGPTASGKTGLGVALALALRQRGEQAEIINADAYQMYRGMDVGTAKPTVEERAAVPHHLVDVIEPRETMSVARFQEMARGLIDDLRERGVRPILVGGSGLYTRAVLDDLSFPGTDQAVRSRIEERAENEGAGLLFKELEEKDPRAAARMDPRNVRRTVRALEVMEITGRPYSATLPRYRYLLPAVQIGLDLDREELDRRIDARTEAMRRNDLVGEVRRLRDNLGTTAARALGYPQVEDYLDGRTDLDGAFSLIAQKTKRLARKQMGWFGRDPRIHWLNALAPDLIRRALDLVDQADNGDFDGADREADQDEGLYGTRHPLGSLDGESI